ncbi:MAG: polyprenyl synthetase family protein [Candidatus Methanomethylophilaceae archaeon]|nr:polyprenyl synthetase family protein [Candidatus Methanomethylophilaceae archaeon]
MDVKQRLKEMSAELDGPIRSYIEDELPSNLIEAARQYPYAGGKRMRPCMVVAACRAVGGDGKKAVPMAVAIEYIHNFTLIHDDLMDGDEMRRGMKTSHVIYGMPTAILAGDALFAKAYQIIGGMDIPAEDLRRVLSVTSKAVWDLARGQQMDVNNENAEFISLDDYIETIKLKTSVLFAAGAASGAIIGGASKEVVNAIHSYAIKMVVAFQMYDDILGVYGDPAKTGKSAGNDIRKGKYTVMICHAHDTIKDKAVWDRFMSVFGKLDATDDEIGVARQILKDCGSYDYAIEMADRYTNEAIDSLNCLKESDDKEFMIELAKFSMARDV